MRPTPEERLLQVYNAQQRKQDFLKLSEILTCGELGKREALVLRGRLGFADSFMHGRLGKLVLKKIVDHAYSRQKRLDDDTVRALMAMKTRLESGRPVCITDGEALFVYTDAAYETTDNTGGIGAVLVSEFHG